MFKGLKNMGQLGPLMANAGKIQEAVKEGNAKFDALEQELSFQKVNFKTRGDNVLECDFQSLLKQSSDSQDHSELMAAAYNMLRQELIQQRKDLIFEIGREKGVSPELIDQVKNNELLNSIM